MIATLQGLVALAVLTTAFPQAAASDDALAQAIEAGRRGVREHLLGPGRTPGAAVAVALAGELVWEEGFGLADIEHQVTATATTRFGIGSLSKMLTMTCALRLAELGLLDLDTPVEDYLSAFPFAGEGITIRRLAAHQSGLSDEVTTRYADSNVHFDSVATAYDAIVHGERLLSPPGSKVVYSNGPLMIVARVLEVVADDDYASLMQRHVLGPAGMRSTTPNDRRAIIPGRTGFYELLGDGRFAHATRNDPSIKLAAAGWLSTAADIVRFGAALLDGELLGPEALREFLSTVPLANGTPTEYALGLRLTDDEGRAGWHHPGGGHGISCWFLLYPEQELAIAILSNCNRGPVGGQVMGVLTEQFVRLAERQDD